jgi:hypothetical protein
MQNDNSKPNTSLAPYGLEGKVNCSAEELWTKNKFNSALPLSLLLYLNDQSESCVYVKAEADGSITNTDITVAEIFDVPDAESVRQRTRFLFESEFQPFCDVALKTPKADIVVQLLNAGDAPIPHRPYEVKLTVIPDATTRQRAIEDWSSEIIFRPSTTESIALSIFLSAASHSSNSIDALRLVVDELFAGCPSLGAAELSLKEATDLLAAADSIIKLAAQFQRPFVLQTTWRCDPSFIHRLADDAFDVFVWSDVAILHLAKTTEASASRKVRGCLRVLFVLKDLLAGRTPDLSALRAKLNATAAQSDKDITANGTRTVNYLRSPRRAKPKFNRAVLQQLLPLEGLKFLAPERRLDASIFYFQDEIFTADATDRKEG